MDGTLTVMQAVVFAEVCFTSWSNKCVIALTCGQPVTIYTAIASETVIVTKIHLAIRSSESETVEFLLSLYSTNSRLNNVFLRYSNEVHI